MDETDGDERDGQGGAGPEDGPVQISSGLSPPARTSSGKDFT